MAGEDRENGGFTFGSDTPAETGLIEEQEISTDSTPPEGFVFGPDQEEITIEREAGEDTTGLRTETEVGILKTEIDGTEVLRDYSPEVIQALQGFFEEHAGEVDGVISDIETATQEATEMTLEELTQAHADIRLEGEFAELGTMIESDVERILGLEDGEEISLSREDGEYIFETKQETLLYLYYEKVSIFLINEYVNTLIETGELTETPTDTDVSGGGESMSGNVKLAILGLVGVLGVTGLNMRRNFRLRGEARSLGTITVDGQEYTQESIRNIVRETLQGSSNREAQIHRITGSNNFWRNLGRIQGRSEGTSSIAFVRHRGNFYTRFQEGLVRDIVEAQRVRQEIIADFTDSRRGGRDFSHAEAIVALDHDTTNTDEFRLTNNIRNFQTSVVSGNLDYIYGMDVEGAKIEIRKRILAQAYNGRIPSNSEVTSVLGDNSSTPGTAADLLGDDVTNYQNITNIDTYESTLAARQVQANLDGVSYDSENVRIQLQRFFSSIGDSSTRQHRYTYYSASSAIEEILSGASLEEAMTRSFPPNGRTGENIRTIITDPIYLEIQNTAHRRQLISDLTAQLNTLQFADEIQQFRERFINPISKNGNYIRGFAEFGTLVEQRLSQIQNNPRPALAAPTRAEVFRTDGVFEADNSTLTPNAQLIFEANIASWTLEGRTLSEAEIQNLRINLEDGSITNMGDLLDRLENHPQSGSMMQTPEEANTMLNRFYQNQAEDIVERFHFDQFGNINSLNGVTIAQRNSDGSMRIEIRSQTRILGTMQVETEVFTVTDIEDFQNKFITHYADSSYILPSGTDLQTRGVSIDISRFQTASRLRSIDWFFRKAR